MLKNVNLWATLLSKKGINAKVMLLVNWEWAKMYYLMRWVAGMMMYRILLGINHAKTTRVVQ